MKVDDELLQSWISSADDDLSYAKVGFEETDLWANVCFSCHQSFEKYLKAFLLSKKVDFPKTHDLTKLIFLCASQNKGISEFEDSAAIITPYSVVTRYPDIGEIEFSKDQAKYAIDSVEKLKEFVVGELHLKDQ